MGEGVDEGSCPGQMWELQAPDSLNSCGNCCVNTPVRGSHFTHHIEATLAALALYSIVASMSRNNALPVTGVGTLTLVIALNICSNDQLLINCNRKYNYVIFYIL